MAHSNIFAEEINQPIINIGIIGHVSNGKSTVVRGMSQKITQKYKKEIETNKTIKLGYANCKIYKCQTCEKPQCYKSVSSDINEEVCEYCNNKMVLARHVSFVDSPGHNILMATMLNGACIMDSAVLIESAANKIVPAPQTAEHLIVAEVMNLSNPCICINKIDLVDKKETSEKISILKKFVEGTIFEKSPIIPVSANFNINLDILGQYIVENIKIPDKQINSDCEMIIVRSFNVNHQHISITELQGGVVGGSIIMGKLMTNQNVRLLPGFVVQNPNNDTSYIYKPIDSKVIEIYSENNKLDHAISGGLIATKLTIDPYFTIQDKLIGNILISNKNTTYKVLEEFTVKFTKIKQQKEILEEDYTKISENDIVTINSNAKNIDCVIGEKNNNLITFKSKTGPICAKIGGKITISKKSKVFGPRIIGYGIIESGKESKLLV